MSDRIFWEEEIETLPRPKLEQLQLELLREHLEFDLVVIMEIVIISWVVFRSTLPIIRLLIFTSIPKIHLMYRQQHLIMIGFLV